MEVAYTDFVSILPLKNEVGTSLSIFTNRVKHIISITVIYLLK